MTVQTPPLEDIDWERVLDDSPVCENPDGCDHEATLRIVWMCSCGTSISCQPCLDELVEVVAAVLAADAVPPDCQICGRPFAHRATQISDFFRAEAL